MTTSTEPRATASDGVKRLRETQLPAISAAPIEILKTLAAGTAPSAGVAESLQRDPVVACTLMQRALQATGTSTCRSPTHALALLGADPVARWMRQMPMLRTPAEQREHPVYLRAVLTAELAAQIAHRMAMRRQPAWQEEVVWNTLRIHEPWWRLCWAEPDKAQALQHLVITHRAGSLHAQRRILGQTFNELADSLMTAGAPDDLCRLYFSDPATHLSPRQQVAFANLRPGDIPDNKNLRAKLQEQIPLIQLASALAQAAMIDWYDRRTLRLQHVAAGWTRVPLAEFLSLCRDAALAVSAETLIRTCLSPAARLLLPPGAGKAFAKLQIKAATPKPATPTRPAADPRPVTKAGAPLPARTAAPSATSRPAPTPPLPSQEPPGENGASAALPRLLVRLQKQPSSFEHGAQALGICVETFFGTGLCRQISALRVTQDRRQLTEIAGQQQPGLSGLPLAGFLTSGSVLERLCRKTAITRLHRQHPTLNLKLLPPAVGQACAGDELILMSLCLNHGPIALLALTPQGQDNELLTRYLRSLGGAVLHTLETLRKQHRLYEKGGD